MLQHPMQDYLPFANWCWGQNHSYKFYYCSFTGSRHVQEPKSWIQCVLVQWFRRYSPSSLFTIFAPLSPQKLNLPLLFFAYSIALGTSTGLPNFRVFHPLPGAVYNLCSTCQVVHFDFSSLISQQPLIHFIWIFAHHRMSLWPPYYFPRGPGHWRDPGHFKFVHTVPRLTHQNHVDCVVVLLIYVLASFQGKICALSGETNPNLCTPSENEAKS